MGLLDFLRPMKVYTAAEVHAEITAKVAMLMEEMKKQVEAVSLPVEIQSELELLRTTGLINSRNMQALADAENHVNRTNEERKMTAERIKLIQLLHKHYGKDVMLMRLEDFISLMYKYNLTCGMFEDYTGSIPKKNLEEVVRAKAFCEQEQISWHDEDYAEKRWLTEQLRRCYKITQINYDSLNIETYKRFPLIPEHDYFNSRGIIVGDKSNIFIAAPIQEMNNVPKIVERIRTEDPFVFSVAKQGVIIYSAWGDEGNDEVVQKYRKINEWIASCEALKRLEE